MVKSFNFFDEVWGIFIDSKKKLAYIGLNDNIKFISLSNFKVIGTINIIEGFNSTFCDIISLENDKIISGESGVNIWNIYSKALLSKSNSDLYGIYKFYYFEFEKKNVITCSQDNHLIKWDISNIYDIKNQLSKYMEIPILCLEFISKLQIFVIGLSHGKYYGKNSGCIQILDRDFNVLEKFWYDKGVLSLDYSLKYNRILIGFWDKNIEAVEINENIN